MTGSISSAPRLITVVRWIARVWSLLLLAAVVLMALTPDPNIVDPVPVTDWIELGFYGLALMGLLLAWRWEALGGAVALIGIIGQDVAFRLFRGEWFHEMPGSYFLMLAFVLPAALFLICWFASRRAPRASDEAIDAPRSRYTG